MVTHRFNNGRDMVFSPDDVEGLQRLNHCQCEAGMTMSCGGMQDLNTTAFVRQEVLLVDDFVPNPFGPLYLQEV